MTDETTETNEGTEEAGTATVTDIAVPARRGRKRKASTGETGEDTPQARPDSAKAMGWDVIWHGTLDPRQVVMREDLQGRHYDDDVSDMVLSLLEEGQKSPICVRRREDGAQEVIFGNRRVRAGIEILEGGLRDKFELRYEQVEVDDERAFSANVAENNARLELSEIDYAHIILRLKSYNRSQADIAKRLNRSSAWVSKTLSLLKLTEQEQRMVHLYSTSGGKKGIAPATAYELAEKDTKERAREVKQILNESSTGKVTRAAVRKQRRTKDEEAPSKQRTAKEIRTVFEDVVIRAKEDEEREEMTPLETVCVYLVDFCKGKIGERALMNALQTYL